MDVAEHSITLYGRKDYGVRMWAYNYGTSSLVWNQ